MRQQNRNRGAKNRRSNDPRKKSVAGIGINFGKKVFQPNIPQQRDKHKCIGKKTNYQCDDDPIVIFNNSYQELIFCKNTNYPSKLG